MASAASIAALIYLLALAAAATDELATMTNALAAFLSMLGFLVGLLMIVGALVPNP